LCQKASHSCRHAIIITLLSSINVLCWDFDMSEICWCLQLVKINGSPIVNGGGNSLLKWLNFRLWRARDTLTLTLDRVILHTIMRHSSTSTYIPNFIEIENTFCGPNEIVVYDNNRENSLPVRGRSGERHWNVALWQAGDIWLWTLTVSSLILLHVCLASARRPCSARALGLCLFVCLYNFIPFFLLHFLLSLCFLFYLFTSLHVYFVTYLSTFSRIDPVRFHAGGRRRWPNLALVFCVHFML